MRFFTICSAFMLILNYGTARFLRQNKLAGKRGFGVTQLANFRNRNFPTTKCLLIPGTNECMHYDSKFQATTLAEAIENFPDLGTVGNDKKSSKVGSAGCKSAMITRLRQLHYIGKSEKIEGLRDISENDDECDQYKFSKNKWKIEGKFRRKRRTNELTTKGEQFTISCINKGEPREEGNPESLSLCGLCWVWRQLPTNYYPTYVNELVCREDTSCLAGFGSCHQQTRILNVMRYNASATNDRDKWEKLTINSDSSCDCQIRKNSVLHALILS